METVAKTCRKFGSQVNAETVDVAERDAMARWIESVDALNPLDLVIANAGTSAGTGSQVRGSILRPASWSGNYAIKPTFGALNRLGGHSMSPSQSVLGVHAGTLEDCWATAYYISSTAGGDPGHPGLYGEATLGAAKRPKRLIRLDTLGWQNTEDETKDRFEAFLGALGDQDVEIISRRDDPDIESFEQAMTTILDFLRPLFAWEMQWPGKVQRDKGEHLISQEILGRIARGESMTIEDYRQALKGREALCAAFEKIRGKADAYVTLTALGPPPVGMPVGDPVYGDVSSCPPAWRMASRMASAPRRRRLICQQRRFSGSIW